MSLRGRATRFIKKYFGGGEILGADVSLNQGVVDMQGAKNDGVIFMGIRWGQRDGKNGYTDPYVKQNWTNALKAALDRMAYWVWDERAGHDAQDHFDGVVGVYPVYDGELPFVADLELEPLDWDEFHRWLIMLEDWTGRKPMIYCGSWFYDNVAPLPEWLEEYVHWLTGYNDEGPDIWGPFAELDAEVVCWQQTSSWRVDWVESGVTDRDYWIKDYQKYRQGDVNMGEKVVSKDDLEAWIEANSYTPECPECPDPPDPPPTNDRFVLSWMTPEPKVITQWYGINPQWYQPYGLPGHEGLDMRATNGTPIYAAADGEVVRVEANAGSGPYGVHVRILHEVGGEQYKTVYAHFQKPKVDVGEMVKRGDVIGLADNTGNSSGAHLHFTLKHVGKGSPWLGVGDIVNPVPYLPDLFPECTIPGYEGTGWRVDVGGNFRTSPRVEPNNSNLIRYISAGATVISLGEVDWMGGGDWWQIRYDNRDGWFWNPGYKLSAK